MTTTTTTTTTTLDDESLLADVPGDATLDAIETDLAARGLTLGLAREAPDMHEMPDMTVRAWIASGTPGARSPFADPADHVVAGLEATLVNGERLVLAPAPRRAVGPDLVALVTGTGARFAKVDRAWLRVHRRDARRPSAPLPGVDLDPPISPEEAALLARIAL